MAKNYHPHEIEKKWQKKWAKKPLYKAKDFSKNKKYYSLVEFPYPTGEGLHIGHAFTNTILDVFARKKRTEGFNVLQPMGWDSFGLPAENYAIKTGIHPMIITKKNTKRFHEQNDRLAISYDWSREIDTTDPKYYKWTQWIFLQLFKHGLAYKEKTPVGWCPSCKIILANEEIVAGNCERCGHEAEYRQQKQWLLGITKYADRLADELDLVDYPEYVKASQRNWIGRSKGVEIEFPVQDSSDKIRVFTTRPDTLYGTTAMVLAPEHWLIEKILKKHLRGGANEGPLSSEVKNKIEEVRIYVEKAQKKSELERVEFQKEKTGIFTGLYCIHPISNEAIQIWVGDYVIASYGGGAVMVVPAHDERDRQFAKKHKLETKAVVKPKFVEEGAKSIKELRQKEDELFEKVKNGRMAFEGPGIVVNSNGWNGLKYPEDLEKIIEDLEKKGVGKKTVIYHLRDWIFSRQHYWGEPIPVVYCQACASKKLSWWDTPEGKKFKPIHLRGGAKTKLASSEVRQFKRKMAGWMPVSEKDLPVKLPKVEKYQPTDTGESPLANVKNWVKMVCPECGGNARRETDTMPNWAGSSWYFLRYCDPYNYSCLADKKKLDYWLPIDVYLGGAEHTTLHLLYSRFWHKFLNDIGVVPGKEPYAARRQHGVILGENGQRMSKSRGNVINPEDVMDKFGVDTLRVYLMFMGPYDAVMPWDTKGVEGAYRFLARIWRIYQRYFFSSSKVELKRKPVSFEVEGSKVKLSFEVELKKKLHQTIKKVSEDIENLKHNTAIAALMEFLNEWQKRSSEIHFALSKKDAEIFLQLLAPFAPYLAEELWQQLKNTSEVKPSSRSLSSEVKLKQIGVEKWSIHQQFWPKFDPNLVKEEMITLVIQVNGKVRGQIKLSSDQATKRSSVEKVAKKEKNVAKYLKKKKIKKAIFIPSRLINFVV